MVHCFFECSGTIIFMDFINTLAQESDGFHSFEIADVKLVILAVYINLSN
jgi:hypothetical protein